MRGPGPAPTPTSAPPPHPPTHLGPAPLGRPHREGGQKKIARPPSRLAPDSQHHGRRAGRRISDLRDGRDDGTTDRPTDRGVRPRPDAARDPRFRAGAQRAGDAPVAEATRPWKLFSPNAPETGTFAARRRTAYPTLHLRRLRPPGRPGRSSHPRGARPAPATPLRIQPFPRTETRPSALLIIGSPSVAHPLREDGDISLGSLGFGVDAAAVKCRRVIKTVSVGGAGLSLCEGYRW